VQDILVEVRQAEKEDLAALEFAFPIGPAEKHAERLQRQSRGEVLYLVAWYKGKPVGHSLLKWQGAAETHIQAHFEGRCPDVEDLFVITSMRSRSVGRQILLNAEQHAKLRGYVQIGLSVGVHNTRAKSLYSRLGYRDAQLGDHYESGEYVDADGQLQKWEEKCIYLIKALEDSLSDATLPDPTGQ
jgi:GNAT superfamily N-acetyltransferase